MDIKELLKEATNKAYWRGANDALNIIVSELEKGHNISDILVSTRMSVVENAKKDGVPL